MKKICIMVFLALTVFLIGCGTEKTNKGTASIEPSAKTAGKAEQLEEINEAMDQTDGKITKNTTVGEIITDPAFADFGRLLFPVDRSVPDDMTLAEVSTGDVYAWYSNIQVEKTIEIISSLQYRAKNGEQIFYHIYSEEEMKSDSSKQNTGLFFFEGEADAPVEITNAGGGFVYVGAMHDSFPHALEVSNRNTLNAYGLNDIPQAKAVIMQYTGYTAVSKQDAATNACVGTSDGIADYRTVENRLERLSALGIATEFHAYQGLGHGFGLGTGTVADGWVEDAISFWEEQMQ